MEHLKNAISSKYACKCSLNRKFRTFGRHIFTAIVTEIVFVIQKSTSFESFCV